jgi:hypothetical protein
VGLGGVHEDRQVGQALPDALVDLRGDLLAQLGHAVGVALADRAGHRERHPAGIVQRPFLDVEVERADRGEQIEMAFAETALVGWLGGEQDPLFPCLRSLTPPP